jgi:hypothetical protein
MELMLMMVPLRRAFMPASTVHAIQNPHHVDVEHLLPLGGILHVGLSQQHDAGIVDQTSHRADCASACATAAFMAAVSVTSTPMQRVSGRFSACMGSTRRASNSSGWPAAEKARAMAAPIPADAR